MEGSGSTRANKGSEIFYGRFYGFTQPPFHITPDPAMLFATETHRQALASLEYGIAAGKGFIVLIGEVGVGKTTLLRACIDEIGGGSAKVIYLFDPVLSVADLYRTLLEELGVNLRTRSVAKGLRELQKRLLALHEKGERVIIAVDEAQNMPEQTLECLRMLSNLETSTTKLMQIILVGQPELDAVLTRHSLRQLAQRIAVRAGLKPLTRRQSRRYIQHRIERAGRNAGPPLFTRPALWYITSVARGVPRSLNICCDNALINGFGHGSDRITLRIAMEACRPMRRPAFGLVTAATAAVAVIAVSTAFGIAHFGGLGRESITLRQGSIQRVSDLQDGAGSRTATLLPAPDEVAPPVTPPQSAAPQSATAQTEQQTPPQVAQTPAAAPAAPPVEVPAPRSVETTESAGRAPDLGWKWRVRRGDTLAGICQATYSTCGNAELHALLARNPQIARNMRIRVGEIVTLPQQLATGVTAAHSN